MRHQHEAPARARLAGENGAKPRASGPQQPGLYKMMGLLGLCICALLLGGALVTVPVIASRGHVKLERPQTVPAYSARTQSDTSGAD